MIKSRMKSTLPAFVVLALSVGVSPSEAAEFFEGADSGFPAPEGSSKCLAA